MKNDSTVRDYLVQINHGNNCKEDNLPGQQVMTDKKDDKQNVESPRAQRLELIKKRIEAGFYEQEEILREIAEEILKSGQIPAMRKPLHLKDKTLN